MRSQGGFFKKTWLGYEVVKILSVLKVNFTKPLLFMEEVFSFLHVSFNAYYFIVTPSIVFDVWVIY